MSGSRRATIADIARIAGVSPGAVSFALNNRPGVSEDTRARILRIAAEQQWQPSSAARALVGAKANVVGLALNRPARSLGAEAFFTELIAGIEAGLSEHHISLQLRLVRSTEEEVAVHQRWHAANQVDGVILIDPRFNDKRIEQLHRIGQPAVVIGSRPSAQGEWPSVWIDDSVAAAKLFDYLAALGHRDIGYVTGNAEFEHTRLRAGVLSEMSERGVSSEVIATDFSLPASADATRTLLSRRNAPTALVYDNDSMAVSGLRVAQEMGIAVPKGVTIASFDDSAVAALVQPSITALTRDTFDLGERAAALLLRQIDANEPLASVPGPMPTLTVRESTARPSGAR